MQERAKVFIVKFSNKQGRYNTVCIKVMPYKKSKKKTGRDKLNVLMLTSYM